MPEPADVAELERLLARMTGESDMGKMADQALDAMGQYLTLLVQQMATSFIEMHEDHQRLEAKLDRLMRALEAGAIGRWRDLGPRP
jgi:hypothetical protein